MTSPILDALAAVVGPQHVLTDAADLASYSSDGRGITSAPLAVARPKNRDEISKIITLCADHHIRLIPQGARTGLTASAIADQSGQMLLLNLDRLSAPPVIDAANRTARVEAGVRLSTLNQAAEPYRLFFPIDLGADPSIGGMVATNTGGARFLRYGDVRRNLLSVELLTAEAEPRLIRLGQELWKDNSALDLKQLLIGSGGMMGIITEVTIALSRLPSTATTAMIALPDPKTALDLLIRLEGDFGPLLTAFEGISQKAMDAALFHLPRLRRPFTETPVYAVLVELSGGAAIEADWLDEHLAASLTPMMESGAITDVILDRGDSLWALRHAVPEGLRASGKVVGCDISMKRGDMFRFREEATALLAELFPQFILHDFGHIGDGGMHFNLVWPSELGKCQTDQAEAARALIFTLCVDAYHGSFSAEHGLGPINAAYYRRHTSPDVQRITEDLRQYLAPIAMGHSLIE